MLKGTEGNGREGCDKDFKKPKVSSLIPPYRHIHIKTEEYVNSEVVKNLQEVPILQGPASISSIILYEINWMDTRAASFSHLRDNVL